MSPQAEEPMKEIQERVTRLEEKTDTILNNHLPHIQTAVDKVSDKQDRFLWLLLTTLLSGVITLAVMLLK